MDLEQLFRRLGVALAIGLLIGLERGWQSREEMDGRRTAGLRTFALTGLLGGLCALLSATTPLVLPAGLLAFTVALVSFGIVEARAEQNFSATGVVAAILTFVLGAYAVIGNQTAAIGAAVATVILLALRHQLHSWLRALTWPELRSVLVLLAMSFLLLPILPDQPVDPWGVLAPSEIWLLAILLAAISFVGYIAVRLAGERRGIAIAAIAGGLASSTATTLSFAHLAREHPGSSQALAGGILLSGATMFARVGVLVGLIKPGLLPALAWPIGAALIALLAGAAALQWRRGERGEDSPALTIRNPFDLTTVLWLSALIAAIILVTKILADAYPASIYFVAIVSGIADIDALTLSMLRLAGAGIAAPDASLAILLAAAVNTTSKAVMSAAVGGRALGVKVGFVSACALLALGLAFLLAPQGV